MIQTCPICGKQIKSNRGTLMRLYPDGVYRKIHGACSKIEEKMKNPLTKMPLTKMLKNDALTLADELVQLRKQIEAYQERQRRIAEIADDFDRLGTEWYFSPQLSERYSDAAAKIREVLGE